MKITRIRAHSWLFSMAAAMVMAVGLLGAVGARAATLDANGVDLTDPGTMIASSAKLMLADIDAHRAEYLKDPAKVEGVVSRLLLPYFDTDFAAQRVLGKYWTNATAEQRKRFIDGFYHSMLRNYSSALATFQGDRLQVLPYRGDPNATSATVKTKVRKNDGGTVEVNYELRKTQGMWKAWNMHIEGVSYVTSFKQDYTAEIDRIGLDALIVKLEAGAAGKKN
jgi:phospholipid transport system substrate-binding protein